MKKSLLIFAAVIMAAATAGAQTQLPNDPVVKTGKFSNGMTYYIRHNELPKGRAEFYLATNVGAIQETPDQDGLAHFLEHMCFNGLKNLPGKQMLEYLQHIGAEFGRNINASTGVEHTQYMLNNIPVSREGIIDTCLLVMHDYSHFVLNEQKEIDSERGVILEEKRTRNTAGWRMFEKSAPYLYGDSKYATCTIIGSADNLKNFKRESLVNFYQTWYQPDMQALIVIGDIDPDKILAKAEKLFSDIPAPATPTVKVMPKVAVNDETVVGIITDPENTSTDIEFIWKTGEPTPKALNGTDAGYVERLLKRIIRGVMSERFEDITSKADSPFLGASFSNQKLCETCDAFVGDVVCENTKVLSACEAYLTEIEKMRRYGFSDDEINRVKENILKGLRDKVAGESTRKNAEFVYPIINNFFSGYPYMTPETELQIAQQLFPMISAQVVNSVISQAFTGEHLTIIYTGVDQPGHVHPDAEQLKGVVAKVKTADIKAPVAEVINSDFMAGRTIKAGKVKKSAAGLYSSTEWTFKNGLKVVVLPTDYKKDQVVFEIRKAGGLSNVPTEDIASLDETIMSIFHNCSGIATFSSSTVSKMLTGKNVNVYPFIDEANSGVKGNCSPEDIETALQIANLLFTAPRFDQEEWDVAVNQLNAVLPNMVTTPNYLFNQHLTGTLYNSPRMSIISPETLKKANIATLKKYSDMMFADVTGATMFVVGNVDITTLKPLIEKYLGSVKGSKKALTVNYENIIAPITGRKVDEFRAKMETPKATVFQHYSAKSGFNVQKSVDLKAAEFILDMIYTESLREEEGGTYGASASISLSYFPVERATIQVYFDTNIEQQQKLRELAAKGLANLAKNGPTEEQLTRAIENAKKNLPEKRISNSYWLSVLKSNDRLGIDFDDEYEKAVNGISAKGIKDALGEILGQHNFVEIVMLPQL